MADLEDFAAIGMMPRISRNLNKLFAAELPWKTKLIMELGVKKENLNQLEELRSEGKIVFHCQFLYARWYKFTIERMNKTYQISLDEDNQIFQLAACVGDEFFLRWVPKELLFDFHLWTICAGVSVMDEKYLIDLIANNDATNSVAWLLEVAMQSYNSAALLRLLSLKNEKGDVIFSPTEKMINMAIENGDYLLALEMYHRVPALALFEEDKL
jgi:hypothetical protein